MNIVNQLDINKFLIENKEGKLELIIFGLAGEIYKRLIEV